MTTNSTYSEIFSYTIDPYSPVHDKFRLDSTTQTDSKSIARVHYEELSTYLANQHTKESTITRSYARQKLTRLTKELFQELSTDVYDEVMRRMNYSRNKVRFLPIRDDFHPKRNRARQKLATLLKVHFKDLSSDVFYELGRRYPELHEVEIPKNVSPFTWTKRKPDPSYSDIPFSPANPDRTILFFDNESIGRSLSVQRRRYGDINYNDNDLFTNLQKYSEDGFERTVPSFVASSRYETSRYIVQGPKNDDHGITSSSDDLARTVQKKSQYRIKAPLLKKKLRFRMEENERTISIEAIGNTRNILSRHQFGVLAQEALLTHGIYHTDSLLLNQGENRKYPNDQIVSESRNVTDLSSKVTLIADEVTASGGFGDIRRGWMSDSDVFVALKLLHVREKPFAELKLTKRFRREMIIWSRLDHINILPFLGIAELEKPKIPTCFVSPWMKNGNCIDYFKKYFDAPVMPLVLGIARGLAYLHSQEPAVIHGDLRAANVLVSNTGEALLADFGLSLIIENLSELPISTALKGAGNTRWMAFELQDRDSLVSKETDIWALGMVILELMTGEIPFYELKTELQVISALIRGARPERPGKKATSRGLSNKLSALMQECWSQDPKARPRSQDVVNDIEKIMES